MQMCLEPPAAGEHLMLTDLKQALTENMHTHAHACTHAHAMLQVDLVSVVLEKQQVGS